MSLPRLLVLRPRTAVTITTVLAAACAGERATNPITGNTTPATITAAAGDNQSGTVGGALADPLVVTVRNSDGETLRDVAVSWTVVSGGGSLASPTSSTNAEGRAQITYTLGPAAGANTVQAAVSSDASLSVTFTATGTGSAADLVPASIQIAGGDNQSATVNTALGSPLTVRVRNPGGQPLAGIGVTWTVTGGGGRVGAAASTTNASGIASNTYTVGPTAGPNTVTAVVTSDNSLSVTFDATATAVANGAVAVGDNFFDPNAVSVGAGGTVTWTWGGVFSHNVTWVSGGFTNSSTQSSGTHEVTFSAPGTFQYYCTIHGTPTTGMRGSVTVQ